MGANKDNDSGEESGSAYIFEQRYDGHWVEADKLLADDGESNDWFGISVSLDGLYALVGAYGDDDEGTNAGAAYIFERQGDGSHDIALFSIRQPIGTSRMLAPIPMAWPTAFQSRPTTMATVPLTWQ